VSTTINSYSVALGLNADGLINGSMLARNEAASLTRTFKQLATPTEQLASQISRMDNAFRKGGISASTHAEAVSRVASRYIQASPGVNNLRDALARADMMLKQGTIDLVAHARAVDNLRQHYQANRSVKGVGGSISGSLVGLAASYMSVHAAANFASTAIRKSADVERAAASYEVLTGSAEQAKDIMGGIRDIAAKGISFGSLSQAANVMLANNVASQDILPTLRQMSEITGGNTERMQRMALAFSQVSGNGRLMAEELNQMVEAGFNPLVEISRTTGVSVADLRKQMADGLISFDMVQRAFESVTSEGGRFNGMLDRINDTTAGALNTVSARFETFQIEVGDALSPVVQMIAKDFTEASGSASDFAGSVSSISQAIAGLSEEMKSITGTGLTDFIAKFNGVALTLKGFSAPVDLFRSMGLTSGSVGLDEESRKIRMEASQRVRDTLGDSMFSQESIKMIDDYFAKQNETQNAVDKANAAKVAAEKEVEVKTKLEKATEKRFQTKVDQLEAQLAKLKGGKTAGEVAKAQGAGFNETQTKKIEALSKEIAFEERKAKLAKERQKIEEQLRDKFSPQDKFNETIAKIEALKRLGELDAVEAANFETKAARQFIKDRNSERPFEVKAPEAVRLGSQEAYKLLTASRNAAETKMLKKQEELVAIQEAAKKSIQEVERLLKSGDVTLASID
jgi:tape measure domain-containing protein